MISGLVNHIPDLTLFTARLASDLTPTLRNRLAEVLSKFGSIQSVVLVERQVQGQNRVYRYRVNYAQGSLLFVVWMAVG